MVNVDGELADLHEDDAVVDLRSQVRLADRHESGREFGRELRPFRRAQLMHMLLMPTVIFTAEPGRTWAPAAGSWLITQHCLELM